MIIIIEGPDGSGKTTLAEQISTQTGYPIEHRSKPETEEDRAKMQEDYINLVMSNRNVILDRCWYSEIVYGRVMRDQSYISYDDMYAFEELLANNGGGIIIHCTGATSTLWDRCKKRGEDYITSKSDFTEICSLYDALMSEPHIIPVVQYEYSN